MCYVARPDYQATTPFLLHAPWPVLSYPLFINMYHFLVILNIPVK